MMLVRLKLFPQRVSLWFTHYGCRATILLHVTSLVVYSLAAVAIWQLLGNLGEWESRTLRNLTGCSRTGRSCPSYSDYEELTEPIGDGLKVRSDGIIEFAHFSRELNLSILPTNVLCRSQRRENLNTIDELPFLLIKSRPYETYQRAAIRQSYGKHFSQRMIFALGRTPDLTEVEASVLLEARQHGDILRADFLDIYFNLGQKSLVILRWIESFCAHEEFYMQIDSDTVLYPSNIRTFVSRHKNATRRIYGLCYDRSKVQRRGRWRVSERRYALPNYPLYCLGAAYLMTGDVPSRLMSQLFDENDGVRKAIVFPKVKNRPASDGSPAGNAESTGISDKGPGAADFAKLSADLAATAAGRRAGVRRAYMNIDDAYFTGLLAEQAGVDRVAYADGFKFKRSLKPWNSTSCACQSSLASFEYKSPNLLRAAWREYEQAEARCTR